jgi:flagellar motor switch/type III secretory pathway protein FliN
MEVEGFRLRGRRFCSTGIKRFPIHLSRFWSHFCKIPKHMATAHPLPDLETAPAHEPAAAGNAGTAIRPAPAPLLPKSAQGEAVALSGPVARLPVELDVAIPVREFRVHHLLALEPGQLIESQWGNGEDLPLASGAVQLAWSEFEVVDTQLAVRVTRLA